MQPPVTATRSTSGAAGRAAKAGWLFRGGEGRAMALLIRCQFRNDQKFRMGVLTILPLTVLYIFQGVTRDSAFAKGTGSDFALVGFAIMMFPAMLKMQLTRSDSFRASWIFFAAPVNRATLIRASKNVVVAMFLLPYLIFVIVAMSWATRDIGRSVLHIGLLGLITILLEPELPFAKPTDKNRSTSLFALFIGIAVINVLLTMLSQRLFGSWINIAVTVAAILVGSYFVELLTKARVDEQARNLEFVG